jgi:hypothetical protein
MMAITLTDMALSLAKRPFLKRGGEPITHFSAMEIYILPTASGRWRIISISTVAIVFFPFAHLHLKGGGFIIILKNKAGLITQMLNLILS